MTQISIVKWSASVNSVNMKDLSQERNGLTYNSDSLQNLGGLMLECSGIL